MKRHSASKANRPYSVEIVIECKKRSYRSIIYPFDLDIVLQACKMMKMIKVVGVVISHEAPNSRVAFHRYDGGGMALEFERIQTLEEQIMKMDEEEYGFYGIDKF